MKTLDSFNLYQLRNKFQNKISPWNKNQNFKTSISIELFSHIRYHSKLASKEKKIEYILVMSNSILSKRMN